MHTELVIDALVAAERTRGSLTGAVMHTDHGAQYTSAAFAAACAKVGGRQSMSAIGSSADNALAESFNATFERETLQGRKGRPTEREARLDAFRRLHRCNTRRRHSRLGQRSPIAYETALQTTSTTLTNPHNPCPGFGVKPQETTSQWTATSYGLVSTGMVRTTVLVAVLITDTLFELKLVT